MVGDLKKNTLKKSIFRSFILRLFYGINHVSFYNYEGQYRSVIDNKFLKKNRVKKISHIKNDQFFFKKSETKKRILILWAQEKHLKIHRAERYGGIIQSIITKYGKYIDIKIHPEDTEINKINFGPRSVRAHEIYSRNLPTPAFETADEHSEEGDRTTVLSPNKSPRPEQTPTRLNESIFPQPPVLLNVVPPPPAATAATALTPPNI
jgi:hypothetical protein